jgi:hypothetical protein
MNKNMSAELLHFIVFVDVLDKKTTDLIINTLTGVKDEFDAHRFYKELIRLKTSGDPKQTVKNIGAILNNTLAESIIHQFSDANDKVHLVVFLYENGQKEIADKICNYHAEHGYYYLNDIYYKYNGV